MSKTIFQQSAVASGLVSQEEFDQALQALREEGRPPSDEQVAKKLIAMGKLNRWQAQHLRRGNVRFSLGPYHLIDSLGQGGMGEVYKAEHSIMGRVVAVKILPQSKSTPEAVASFSREIRTQAQLDHENLVRAFDAGSDRKVHFLVTEYVPGTDLRRLIRRDGRLSMSAAAAIISQAARGLGYAHGRGLIHRDVKPGNLLVTPEQHCKVSDLGLAGYFHDSEQTDIHGGKVVGTADYLAPEQITSPDRPTPLSDVYSLGCTLYYAVTGKVPFPGGSAREKARKHCQAFPIDPRRLNPELSDDFVEVIADMMAKDPTERIQSANDVITRLAPWVNREAANVAPPAAMAPVNFSFPAPAAVRASAASLSDTEPIFLVPPAEDPSQMDSPSQASFGTQPMNAASQETLPLFPGLRGGMSPLRGAWQANFTSLPTWVKVLAGVGMATAAATLLAVIIDLLCTAFSTP